jgi:Ser-tRNA(Ala) deacylase AlaX
MISHASDIDRLPQQPLIVVGGTNAKPCGKSHLRSTSQCRLQLLQRDI